MMGVLDLTMPYGFGRIAILDWFDLSIDNRLVRCDLEIARVNIERRRRVFFTEDDPLQVRTARVVKCPKCGHQFSLYQGAPT